MNEQTRKLADEALKLIDSTKYRFGTTSFLVAFLDEWAYKQTGLNPPAKEMPADLLADSIKLSHILSNAMALEPTADVLGYVMSMTHFEKRGTNYFPTPPSIGKLLCALAGVSPNDDTSFYEPCCGSGINAILWMEQYLAASEEGSLSDVSIYLEDIDPIMVKCSMLQILHYLQGKTSTPKLVSIVAIDTISRQTRGVAYYFESKAEHEKANAA